ncbi:AAA family ATPase [Candidatus Pelagibacter bacterium]|nr:AAA family ATPase [Candidatus Pelagibacter bacterium]
MLSKFSIKNIKSYQNEAEVNIKPLTLLYGLNSSGKSTLWKFLATIRISTGGLGMRRSHRDFLNLDSRLYDFADRKTLSFDNTKPSSFSFTFSNSDDETSEIDFKYNFINQFGEINSDETEAAIQASKIIRDRIKVNNEKDKDLLENFSMMVNELQRLQDKTKKIIESIGEPKPDSLKLDSLEIYYKKKLFIRYAIEKLPELPRTPIGQRGTKEIPKKFEKEYHDKISQLLDQYCPNKFKRDYKIKLKKEDWIEDLYGPFTDGQTKVFDFMGPTGPLEIKINNDLHVAKYLFIPTSISEENFFWEEHFNFLKFLKKRIKSLNKTLDEDKVYPRYWGVEPDWDNEYLKRSNINPNSIKEIKNIHKDALQIMKAENIEDFKKIMINNFKTHILGGKSFLIDRAFYGGEVYKQIFNRMVGGFIDSTLPPEDMIEELDGWESEFGKEYLNFQKHSISHNYNRFVDFGKEVSRIMDVPVSLEESQRSWHSLRYDWPERVKTDDLFKKKITDILNRIELPFNIETKEDDAKNLKLVFENKNIKKIGDKQIPLSESGNALSSIMRLIEKIINANDKIIIIEEPENKLHPRIQGHVIELLYEIAKNSNNKLIIETHSEHFILRLQKLVRERKANSKDISINYISLAEDGSGSRVDNMEINNNGDFKNKWRHGFFNERLDEI